MKGLLLDITFDEQEFAFLTGLTFRGLTISEGDPWWTLVLRARRRDGEPVYCMTTAPNIGEGFHDLLDMLGSRDGEKLWRHDRYAR